MEPGGRGDICSPFQNNGTKRHRFAPTLSSATVLHILKKLLSPPHLLVTFAALPVIDLMSFISVEFDPVIVLSLYNNDDFPPFCSNLFSFIWN